jgi:hypothetical protein
MFWGDPDREESRPSEIIRFPTRLIQSENGCSWNDSRLQLGSEFIAGADERSSKYLKWSGIPIKVQRLGYAGFLTS